MAHYAQPIVPMGQVKMGWAGPTRPIDDPYLYSCFIIILMSSLYYLNEMVKNIEVLMFDVS